jgi:hypothetical protein
MFTIIPFLADKMPTILIEMTITPVPLPLDMMNDVGVI